MLTDLEREFMYDISTRLARAERAGVMPEAVAVRADLWPHLGTVGGYPVVRMTPASVPPGKLWGVIV
jgi:hypothetical protein